jgi:prepilin-type N-terminal cleavage/methylation domain-containing protein
MARTDQRGFTLVELLTVIAIIGLTMAAAASAMRPNRGERMRSFSRLLLAVCHEARQTAFSQRLTARVHVTGGSVLAQVRDPANPGNWLPLGGALQTPSGVILCAPEASVKLAAASPACPLSAAMDVCIAPSGVVTMLPAPAACDDNAAGTGATLYLATADQSAKYKVVLFGLTGLPRGMDQW